MHNQRGKWDLFCAVHLWHCDNEHDAHADGRNHSHGPVSHIIIFDTNTNILMFALYRHHTGTLPVRVHLRVLLQTRTKTGKTARIYPSHHRHHPESIRISMLCLFPRYFIKLKRHYIALLGQACIS